MLHFPHEFINRSDTISPLFLTVDAWLSFRTTRDFWNSTKNGITLAEAQKHYRVKGTGKEAILLQMWSALCAIGSAEEKHPAGSSNSTVSTPSGSYNGHLINNHRVNTTMEQLPARVLASALSLKKSHRDRERERSQTLSEILPLPKVTTSLLPPLPPFLVFPSTSFPPLSIFIVIITYPVFLHELSVCPSHSRM